MALALALLRAAAEGRGRGENPSGGTGVVVLVAAILGAILLVGGGLWLLLRSTRGRGAEVSPPDRTGPARGRRGGGGTGE